MHLAAFVDAVYQEEHGTISTAESFPLFLTHVGRELDGLTLLGRLHPDAGRSHYALPAEVEFVALPWYQGLTDPVGVARGTAGAAAAFWSVLGRADAIFISGPHPAALLVLPLAWLRGTPVVLGVRQDTRAYARHRHPDRRSARLALHALERAWELLARRLPIAVVGTEVAARYAHAPRRFELTVSMVPTAELGRARPDPAGPPVVLSVGRLDAEKNPLILADVLADLCAHDRADWRLVICGEGSLHDGLCRRLRRLGVADRAELRGYVPVDAGLFDLYRSSRVLLLASWTEGVPQVLFEAFACGLPVVATDVGGVRSAVGDAAVLVPPGDPAAAATAIRRVVADAGLRARLVAAGTRIAGVHTIEAEARRTANWLRSVERRPGRRRRAGGPAQ